MGAEAYLILLIRAALHREAPPPLPEGVDPETLFALSVSQSMANLVFQSVKRLKVQPEPSLMEKWKQYAIHAELTSLMFQAERERVLALMEAEEICHVCLKGIVLEKIYPARGMREMADQDIFYDAKKQAVLKKIMEQLGYTPVDLESYHDIYHKAPNYNFEMHKSLVDKSMEEYSYYSGIWDRLRKKEGKNREFELTPEDLYIFQLVHLRKHYEHMGTGLKTVTDQYLLWHKQKDSLDFSYIDRELEKLSMKPFADRIMSLAVFLFGTEEERAGSACSEEEAEKEISYLLRSGTYGKEEIGLENRIKKSSAEGHYVRGRIFMPLSVMKIRFPVLERYRWLYPVLFLWRIFEGAAVRRKEIFKELKVMKKIKRENREASRLKKEQRG